MPEKDKSEATPKPESKTAASTPSTAKTVSLVVEDFRVRKGHILVRREDSDALDAYYLYPATDWQHTKTKTLEVSAAELARLSHPVNRLAELRPSIPTPTDWQRQAWKVGLTGQQLTRRDFEQACQQLVQRMLVRADTVRRWFENQ